MLWVRHTAAIHFAEHVAEFVLGRRNDFTKDGVEHRGVVVVVQQLLLNCKVHAVSVRVWRRLASDGRFGWEGAGSPKGLHQGPRSRATETIYYCRVWAGGELGVGPHSLNRPVQSLVNNREVDGATSTGRIACRRVGSNEHAADAVDDVVGFVKLRGQHVPIARNHPRPTVAEHGLSSGLHDRKISSCHALAIPKIDGDDIDAAAHDTVDPRTSNPTEAAFGRTTGIATIAEPQMLRGSDAHPRSAACCARSVADRRDACHGPPSTRGLCLQIGPSSASGVVLLCHNGTHCGRLLATNNQLCTVSSALKTVVVHSGLKLGQARGVQNDHVDRGRSVFLLRLGTRAPRFAET